VRLTNSAVMNQGESLVRFQRWRLPVYPKPLNFAVRLSESQETACDTREITRNEA